MAGFNVMDDCALWGDKPSCQGADWGETVLASGLDMVNWGCRDPGHRWVNRLESENHLGCGTSAAGKDNIKKSGSLPGGWPSPPRAIQTPKCRTLWTHQLLPPANPSQENSLNFASDILFYHKPGFVSRSPVKEDHMLDKVTAKEAMIMLQGTPRQQFLGKSLPIKQRTQCRDTSLVWVKWKNSWWTHSRDLVLENSILYIGMAK